MQPEAKPTVAVCAMGKRPFTAVAGRWIEELRAAGFVTLDHRAVTVGRDVVIDDLNGDVDIVVYVGHGRQRGWSGYQTIRWRHFEATTSRRPVHAVMAFACNTAGVDDDGESFGRQLVDSGRACTYLGWDYAVEFDAGLRFADSCINQLATSVSAASVDDVLGGLADSPAKADERRLLDDLVVHGDRTALLAPGQPIDRSIISGA